MVDEQVEDVARLQRGHTDGVCRAGDSIAVSDLGFEVGVGVDRADVAVMAENSLD